MEIKEGMVFERDQDDARVRVDIVKGSEVYYAAWGSGQEIAFLWRRNESQFRDLLADEGLVHSYEASYVVATQGEDRDHGECQERTCVACGSPEIVRNGACADSVDERAVGGMGLFVEC